MAPFETEMVAVHQSDQGYGCLADLGGQSDQFVKLVFFGCIKDLVAVQNFQALGFLYC